MKTSHCVKIIQSQRLNHKISVLRIFIWAITPHQVHTHWCLNTYIIWMLVYIVVYFTAQLLYSKYTTWYVLTSTSHNSIPNNSGQEWGVPTALKQLLGGGNGYLHDHSEQQQNSNTTCIHKQHYYNHPIVFSWAGISSSSFTPGTVRLGWINSAKNWKYIHNNKPKNIQCIPWTAVVQMFTNVFE